MSVIKNSNARKYPLKRYEARRLKNNLDQILYKTPESGLPTFLKTASMFFIIFF